MDYNNLKEIERLLLFMRDALRLNLLAKNEVINWADDILKTYAEPDYLFIEISLCGSKSLNDLLHCFNEHFDHKESIKDVRPLLGSVHKTFCTGALLPKDAISLMYQLKDETMMNQMELSTIYSIVDDAQLTGTNEVIEKFLSIYKDYTISNYPAWPEIDTAISNYWSNEVSKAQNAMSQHIGLNTSKAYTFARIGAIAFLIAIVAILSLGEANAIGSSLIGLSILLACGAGLIGSWYSIKSFNEPSSRQKLIAMTINFSLAALLLVVLIANFLDILHLIAN